MSIPVGEFRKRVLALCDTPKTVRELAAEMGATPTQIRNTISELVRMEEVTNLETRGKPAPGRYVAVAQANAEAFPDRAVQVNDIAASWFGRSA